MHLCLSLGERLCNKFDNSYRIQGAGLETTAVSSCIHHVFNFIENRYKLTKTAEGRRRGGKRGEGKKNSMKVGLKPTPERKRLGKQTTIVS